MRADDQEPDRRRGRYRRGTPALRGGSCLVATRLAHGRADAQPYAEHLRVDVPHPATFSLSKPNAVAIAFPLADPFQDAARIGAVRESC